MERGGPHGRRGGGGAAARPAAAQRRAAEAYRHVCARLGQPASQEVCAHLRSRGALVVDLQLCSSAEALLVFLREAPRGVAHVSLYNGALFYGHDSKYRQQVHALQKCAPHGVLSRQAQLWQLLAALACFCSARGGGLQFLELTGLPLGRQGHGLAAALARCLPAAPALRRLCLAGCGLRDQGLAELLPHLAGRLPRLSRLSLARNGLRDVRPVAQLLLARATAQGRRQAATFSILDLSGNPGLGAVRAPAARAAARGARLARPAAVTREPLLRAVCGALRAGLRVEVLRLRSMQLRGEDLRPLLLLVAELQQGAREAAASAASGPPGAPPPSEWLALEEVSLEGNPLEEEFPDAIARALWEVHELRSPEPTPEHLAGSSEDGALPRARQPPPCACSAPASGRGARPREPGPPAGVVPERNALSEGEAEAEREPLTRGSERLRQDCALLAGRLDARGGTKAPSAEGPPPERRRRAEAPGGGRPHGRGATAQRWFKLLPADGGEPLDEQDEHQWAIPVECIPDRAAECGFAPPPRGADLAAGSSDAESPQESDADGAPAAPRPPAGRWGSGAAPAAELWGGPCAPRGCAGLLGALAQIDGEDPEPEALRWALQRAAPDFRSSGTSSPG